METIETHDIDLFDSEKRVIDEARRLLESGLIEDEWFRDRYCRLLDKYRKLYRQMRRMIIFSDRIQHDLNLTNEKLYQSEKKYRNLFENVTEGIFRASLDGALIEVNPAMARILGYESPEHFLSMQHREQRPPFLAGTEYGDFFKLLKEKGMIRSFQADWRRHDGRDISVEISAQIVNDETGVLQHIDGILFDVTERKRMHAELKKLADTDGLTGLYNRRYFQEKLSHEICHACEHRRTLSLLMMDVDHFKRVNDRFGHDVGDTVLKKIAETSRVVLREYDILCRIGGEEFAVILPDVDLEMARQIAERLRTAMENSAVVTEQGRVGVTISVGIARLNGVALSSHNLMKQADAALYHAKNNGRNRVCDFNNKAVTRYDR